MNNKEEKLNINELIQNKLVSEFSNKDSSYWEREDKTYHCSDWGKCPLKTYFEFKLGKREDEEAYRVFRQGHDIEAFIQEVMELEFGNRLIKNSYPIKFNIGDIKIVGETDIVRISEDGKKIEQMYEIKSTKNTHYVQDTPNENHIFQVQPYMLGLNLDRCKIIYIDKRDLKGIVHTVEYSTEKYKEGFKRVKTIEETLRGEKEIDALLEISPFEDWECKYACQYVNKCEELKSGKEG